MDIDLEEFVNSRLRKKGSEKCLEVKHNSKFYQAFIPIKSQY